MIFILEWDSTWGRRSTYYVIFSAPSDLRVQGIGSDLPNHSCGSSLIH
jgi:hypothetical protein